MAGALELDGAEARGLGEPVEGHENLRFSRELRSRDRIHATEQAVYPQPAIGSPPAFKGGDKD